MFFVKDIIIYARRLLKEPLPSKISDELIIDYINRFYISDVDARLQLFDLKTKYQFQTQPGVDKYNMPLYDAQLQPVSPPSGDNEIALFPVYQGFLSPAYINGIQVHLHTQKAGFYNIYPNVIQYGLTVAYGDGGSTYSLRFPFAPNFSPPIPPNPPVSMLLRGHVDITGIIATGNNLDPIVGATLNTSVPITSVDPAVIISTFDTSGANMIVQDSGQFLTGNINYGLLMSPGHAGATPSCIPLGGNVYSVTDNTVNYFDGTMNVTFPFPVPVGVAINVQCNFYQAGLPRSILFYNNVLTLRSPPAKQYTVELDAYLTPAAFLDTEKAIPFGYMSEYLARGAARKILSDTGDWTQFQAYEPLFREQELLVWKRSQRIWTSNRTETIYSQGHGGNQWGWNNSGGGL